MQLSPTFRLALYATFWTLFATGGAWLVADEFKEGTNGELWQASRRS